eukprot:scaffold21143_cov48-Phaeocystis_antarctica.AAC.2
MRKTRRLRPRLTGSPEASLSARSCSRVPRASASLGQSAAWAALAPRPFRPCFSSQAWLHGALTLTLTLTLTRPGYTAP